MKTKYTTAILLIAAMLLFIYFNFSTTKQTLEWKLGADGAVTAFAVAISLVDFAGIARVSAGLGVVKNRATTEDTFKPILGAIWFIAIALDVALTFMWGQYRTVIENPGATVTQQESVVISLMVAIAEVTLRVPLVIAVSRMGRSLFVEEEIEEPEPAYRKPKQNSRSLGTTSHYNYQYSKPKRPEPTTK